MQVKKVFTMMGLCLALQPWLARAEINKCVNAAGVVSFSDKPCAHTEKTAEIKADSALASVMARENDRKLGKACWVLGKRYAQCGYSYNSGVNPKIKSYVEDNCEAATKRFVKGSTREESKDRSREYNYNRKYRREVNNDDDDGVLDIYREIPKDALRCDALQTDMWDFVKANFSKKVSDEDHKAITYQLQAVSTEESNIGYQSSRKRKK